MQAKNFMRRYRFPYIAFKEILLPLVKGHNVFESKRNGYVPIEFKLLVSLRMLGRGSIADDMSEMSGVGVSTCYSIFNKFIKNFSAKMYDHYVQMPSGDRLRSIMRAYERMGMPGCIGSMDCTHIWWDNCPERYTNLCKDRTGHTTMSFQAIVGPNREIFHVSVGFPGTYNDKSIAHQDDIVRQIMHGKLKDIDFIMFDLNGVPRKCKGAYVIVDGGYQKRACFMNPDKQT